MINVVIQRYRIGMGIKLCRTGTFYKDPKYNRDHNVIIEKPIPDGNYDLCPIWLRITDAKILPRYSPPVKSESEMTANL